MANLAAARQMLSRLGFNQDAAERIVADDGQGLVDIEDFQELDEESAEVLCKGIRRPGGGGNGHPVSAKAEQNFRAMIKLVQHYKRIDRVCLYGDVTLDNVRKFKNQVKIEDEHKDPLDMPKVDPKDWPGTMEAVLAYLSGFRGVNGVPLDYVLRKEITTLPAGTDPMKGQPNSKYMTHDQEMVARAKIIDGVVVPGVDGPYTESYLADRKKVWTLLVGVFKQSIAWPHLKGAKKDQDGRAGYQLVYDNYLGPNNVDHMAAQAESVLANFKYKGEGPKHNFESYSTLHTEQHNILHSLEEFGYKGIDNRSKVRYLNNGIMAPALDSVKTRIMSDATLRGDFGECVTLYKDFIKQSNTVASTRGISAITNEDADSGDKKKGVTFNIKLEDKFYPDETWNAMSKEEQKKVRELRKNRVAGGGNDSSNKKKMKYFKKKIKALTKKVSNQKRTLAQLHGTRVADDEDSASDADDESNRNHPGLTRQKKRKK